jgi:hypothetical protein
MREGLRTQLPEILAPDQVYGQGVESRKDHVEYFETGADMQRPYRLNQPFQGKSA